MRAELSVRRLRLFGLGAALGTVALLALLLLSPLGKAASMPGPLTSNHAMLAERCDACHSSGPEALQSVWHGIETSTLDLELSENCQACHQLGQEALAPHGRAQGRAQGNPLASGEHAALACNTCHREHNGRQARLTAIEEAACQSCHAEPFSSFEGGHPELADYAHDSRTNLTFDHTAHVMRHFRGAQSANAPSACTDCHAPDSAGERMLVVGFDKACAACHTDEIRGANQVEGAGLAFLGLPALDTYTLEERDVAIGAWPADSAVTEAELTPFLALLLADGESTRADLELFRSLDLLDLSDAEDAELDAVARVAWRIKELFAELEDGGHAALVERTSTALGRELEPEARAALLGHLPEELVRGALASWLPALHGELAARRTGSAPTTDSNLASEADFDRDRQREAWVETGGWYLQDMDFLLRYRPDGHADPFLRAWLDTAGHAAGTPGGNAAGQALFDELSRPTSVGSCTKCHAVDQGSVRWSAGSSERTPSLTRFAHDTHFASPAANACLECHTLGPDDGAYLASFEEADSHVFTPNFAPLSLDTCMGCHGSQGASATCTTCHDYHAEKPSRALPGAALNALLPQSATD